MTQIENMELIQKSYIELIQKYADDTSNAVQEAWTDGTETKISQKLGEMMIGHALVRPMVPKCLEGSVDAIYAEGLESLYDIAADSNAKGEPVDSDLMVSIFDALNGLQERIAGKTETDAEE